MKTGIILSSLIRALFRLLMHKSAVGRLVGFGSSSTSKDLKGLGCFMNIIDFYSPGLVSPSRSGLELAVCRSLLT